MKEESNYPQSSSIKFLIKLEHFIMKLLKKEHIHFLNNIIILKILDILFLIIIKLGHDIAKQNISLNVLFNIRIENHYLLFSLDLI